MDIPLEIYGPAAGVIAVLTYFVKYFSDRETKICNDFREYRDKQDEKNELKLKEVIVVLKEKIEIDNKQTEAFGTLAAAFLETNRRLENVEKVLEQHSG